MLMKAHKKYTRRLEICHVHLKPLNFDNTKVNLNNLKYISTLTIMLSIFLCKIAHFLILVGTIIASG